MNVSNAGARRIRTKRPRQRPYASAMKDKVISESFIDRDSADSADILFYREIYLALGFPMSAVGGVSYGFREVLSQADGRFEMRTDASSRRGRGFYEVRYGGRYLIWYTWYTLPLLLALPQ